MAAVHRNYGITAHQRRRGGGGAHGNAADGRGDKTVHPAAALEQEAAVPVFRQPELEFRAVVFAIHTCARADFAFNHAMRFRLQDIGRAAGEGCHSVGTDFAVRPFGFGDGGVGNLAVFQREALLLILILRGRNLGGGNAGCQQQRNGGDLVHNDSYFGVAKT